MFCILLFFKIYLGFARAPAPVRHPSYLERHSQEIPPFKTPRSECSPPAVWLPGPFFYAAKSSGAITVPEQNLAPLCRPKTPLFISYGSGWCLLLQALLSYIGEGWPPSQIVVVENTGQSDFNAQGTINPRDPTFMNYSLLLDTYGVNIYRSPVRQTFAQMQNLLLELARERNWTDFYQSHQDIVVRGRGSEAFYHAVLREHALASAHGNDWAFTFFEYDWLSHINTQSTINVGPWDFLIPWYTADCDYYSRTRHEGLKILSFSAGDIFDVAACLPDPEALLAPRNTTTYFLADTALRTLAQTKKHSKKGRNTWQGLQEDGTISSGFGPSYKHLVEAGRTNYFRKWHTHSCDLTYPPSSFANWVKEQVMGLFY